MYFFKENPEGRRLLSKERDARAIVVVSMRLEKHGRKRYVDRAANHRAVGFHDNVIPSSHISKPEVQPDIVLLVLAA